MVEEWLIIVGFGVLTIIGAIIGGFLAGVVVDRIAAKDYNYLRGRLEKLEDRVNAGKSLTSRMETTEEIQIALAEAAQIMKGDGTQELKMQAIMGLIQKYPKAALKIGKQLGLV